MVLSIALYRAPIWPPQLLATTQGKSLMRQALRPVAVRAIRGFRSISHIAATTLVGSPPVDLLAEERSILYWRDKELRERAGLTARVLVALWSRVVVRTLERRMGSGLTFHLVQVMTGHWCFGNYLHQIKKKSTTGCHHCPEPDDTVHHTLAEWAQHGPGSAVSWPG
ncbi:uncharacterized protein LOC105181349 [Harpegnathos saltator]|uniref:uncharacterized protein LOC105181349 n=1 Tax=Harpegnathos saltator TaxID=610380 RepID=UPI00058EFA52|nr:uncharacterized protein LOC105181349 [Harpegnathos saltator]